VAFGRITVEPGKMGGVACIRGLRIPVATVVAMVADGMTAADVVRELPSLEVEDVAEALRFAADALLERELPLLRPA
jgi:uncharacterized protein (DUF433 family)